MALPVETRTEYYRRGPLWSQTHHTGLPVVLWHLSAETNHMQFIIKGRADAILDSSLKWLIKSNVVVTRRSLLWCDQVTPCLCLFVWLACRQRTASSEGAVAVNINSHLMVFGQNILGPHAWGESGEGPARSWCVGAWGRRREEGHEVIKLEIIIAKHI